MTRCIICIDNPRYYVDWLFQIALLRICNFEQAPDTCFLRQRLMAQEMRYCYFAFKRCNATYVTVMGLTAFSYTW